jgi:hypothetical protein
MSSLRKQAPEEKSNIQQLRVPMRDLRLAHRPFVLAYPNESGTHFKISVGKSDNRKVTGLVWRDGSFFRANFDLPTWAKDAVPQKDASRIYVFRHSGGNLENESDNENNRGSLTGVRIRIQDIKEFLSVFNKMVEELVAIIRGKRGDVKAANREDKESKKFENTGFPIIGVPLNEDVFYQDAYVEEIDYNGNGRGEYLAVRTSGSRGKAVVELFGPIPTRDHRGRDLNIERLHLREGWQPIIKVNGKNRQEAISMASDYFSGKGFDAQRVYGTLHIHNNRLFSEKNEKNEKNACGIWKKNRSPTRTVAR